MFHYSIIWFHLLSQPRALQTKSLNFLKTIFLCWYSLCPKASWNYLILPFFFFLKKRSLQVLVILEMFWDIWDRQYFNCVWYFAYSGIQCTDISPYFASHLSVQGWHHVNVYIITILLVSFPCISCNFIGFSLFCLMAVLDAFVLH